MIHTCDSWFNTNKEICPLKMEDFETQYRQGMIFDGSQVGDKIFFAKIPLQHLKKFVTQNRKSLA